MDHILRQKLARRDIDGNPGNEQAAIAKVNDLAAGRFDDPVSDQIHQPAIAGDGEEVLGQQASAGGMVPADERFHSDRISIGDFDDRLKFQFELSCGNRFAQFDFGTRVRLGHLIKFGREEAVTVPAPSLCIVHGEIGQPQKLVSIVAIARDQRDADAGAHNLFDAVYLVRTVDIPQQASAATADLVRPCHSAKDQRKLIATDAGGDFVRLNDRVEALCNLAQQDVARLVAARIIDDLEPIEIEQQQGCASRLVLSLVDGLSQPFLEESAVRQAGEHVVQREVRSVFLGKFARRYIDRGGKHAHRLALAIEKRVLVAVEDQLDAVIAKPLFIMRERFAAFQNDCVAPAFALAEFPRAQRIHVTTDELVRLTIEHGRLVGIQEQALAVLVQRVDHDRDGVDDLFEHRLCRFVSRSSGFDGMRMSPQIGCALSDLAFARALLKQLK